MTFSLTPLRVGFFGTGKIALDHAAALRALGHRIVAGCSTSRSSPRWQEFSRIAPEARFEPAGEALLSDPGVDAIVACLPWNVTENWLPRLLASPKPVLIEKPIALSSKRLVAILDQARNSKDSKTKFVGFNRRFYNPIQRLKERLSQGDLKAAEISVSEAVGRLMEQYGAEIVPHVLAFSSSHILDTALYLLGALTPVRIYGHEEKAYSGKFISFHGLLETGNGVPVTLSIDADAPVPVGIRLYFGDATVWHLSPMERLVAYRDYQIVDPTPEMRIRRYLPKAFLEEVVETSIKPGFLEQMRAFTFGDGQGITATPADSVQLLRFIEGLREAAG